jgi:hypothetical protein
LSNPLSPALMSALERRTALCAILALGVVRLKQRNASQIAVDLGESSLHIRPEQSVCRRAKPNLTEIA